MCSLVNWTHYNALAAVLHPLKNRYLEFSSGFCLHLVDSVEQRATAYFNNRGRKRTKTNAAPHAVIHFLMTFHQSVCMHSPMGSFLSKKSTVRTALLFLFQTSSNTILQSVKSAIPANLIKQSLSARRIWTLSLSHRHHNMRTKFVIYSLPHHLNTQYQLLLLGLCNVLCHRGRKL